MMSPGKLQQELKKRLPFQSLEQEAILNLARTNDQVQILFERLFRGYDELTPSQYNILRILRGEGQPMQILEIAERTITVVPGITGLIDRLERKGLVRRERSTEDRRVIYVSITDKALEVLARIDAPLIKLHQDVVGSLAREELVELVRLLEKIRDGCAPKL